MAEQEKENLLKEKIFEIFSKCRNEASHDRRQVYFGQLCKQVYLWCKDYLSFNTDDLGLEIVNITLRITKEESKANIPQDKEGFFKYLYVSLKTEKIEYYRKNEAGIIDIPKNKKYRYKKAEEDISKMKASFSGRELTAEERSQCILRWFKSEEKYIDVKNARNISSLSFIYDEEDNEIDFLNKAALVSEKKSSKIDFFDEHYINLKREIIREAVKIELDKKQERARDCYSALFTLLCIETTKDNGIEWLYPVLDPEILQAYKKDSEKPTRYKIYMKYHPGVKESSANALASKILKDFTDDLKSCLIEKNPEIFS